MQTVTSWVWEFSGVNLLSYLPSPCSWGTAFAAKGVTYRVMFLLWKLFLSMSLTGPRVACRAIKVSPLEIKVWI